MFQLPQQPPLAGLQHTRFDTMKHPNSVQGRVCQFLPREEWDDDDQKSVHLRKIVLAHKVIPVAKIGPGVVLVATVSEGYSHHICEQ